MKRLIAEFIGTMVLVIVGCGTAMLVTRGQGYCHADYSQGSTKCM